ncbi:periplasmic nitrate reductase subunit NapH [Sulfuricurvum kujiense DSM 16994]|uniref:Periplasmic nitrate reductase subunit NapH n=1 Tax=Sulfuricurvum kujiense (strain ATCC BAA-921 / DSM 16994 / JCM 11577 / YK-1) TaxID=709032 RepID=E4U151_SULKY|nr:quinol dehydrogenase ferredoxin subunit NapH [Sulfuricurvum kujiense]ADR33355.1 periplasmic nitrate reductase subunit NapH [Sulfuricurvum kujiense DSM 16994]
MTWLFKHRFLILRRLSQIGMIFLYFAANVWGWKILQGNLGSSLLFETLPLSDPFAVVQMSAAGALLGLDLLIGAGIITLFYALIGGRAFCSWVCPVNMITDAANGLRRLLRINEVEYRYVLSRHLRYWILALSIVLSAIFGVAAFEFVSPIGILNRGLIFGIGFGGAVIAGVFLFDLFGAKNGFCGHLCPLGGFYSLIGRFSLIRVKHNQEKCTVCMKCTEICPEKPVLHMIGKRSEFVTMGECSNCARCIEVCESDALHFDIRFLNQKKSASL